MYMNLHLDHFRIFKKSILLLETFRFTAKLSGRHTEFPCPPNTTHPDTTSQHQHPAAQQPFVLIHTDALLSPRTEYPCPPWGSLCQSLMPRVVVLGGGPFGRRLDSCSQECAECPYRGNSRGPPHPFHHVRMQPEDSCPQTRTQLSLDTKSAGTLDFDLHPPEP